MGLIYARASDEIGHLATVTLTTGTADANYPVANVKALKPSSVFLTTTTAGVDIVFDHGSAVNIQGFSLHHHNLPAGLAGVLVQRNASDSWGAPTISHPVTIGAYPNTGLPLPIAIDLRTASGYGSTMRYSRLHIPAASPVQLTGLGAVCWWATLREDLLHVRYPVRDGLQLPTSVFKTISGARLTYKIGNRLRWMPATFRQRDTGWAAFKALFDDCHGNYLPFLWWPNASNSDGWLAALDSDAVERERPGNTVHDFVERIEELSFGLAIPTSA